MSPQSPPPTVTHFLQQGSIYSNKARPPKSATSNHQMHHVHKVSFRGQKRVLDPPGTGVIAVRLRVDGRNPWVCSLAQKWMNGERKEGMEGGRKEELRDSSVVQRSSCGFSRGPKFGSQYPQPPGTPTLRDPMPSFGLRRHLNLCHSLTQTYEHMKKITNPLF